MTIDRQLESGATRDAAFRLNKEDRLTLSILAKEARNLLWGGVYQKGGEADLIRLEQRGYVEAVAHPYTVGKSEFTGGYRITKLGRDALAASKLAERAASPTEGPES